ncbi:MAG TPA: kelch repeat-containing protein [bacterium]|nr:kelch repeat-containing protein [bacterium]
MTLPGGSVLVCGGRAFRPVSRCEEFLPGTGQWREVGELREPRSEQPAVAWADGLVMIAGGVQAGSAEVFVPATLSWTVQPYARTRSRHQAVLLPGAGRRVALFGGLGRGLLENVAETLPVDVFVRDADVRGWIVAGALPEGRVGHTATALLDGRVLIAGGARTLFAESPAVPCLVWSADGSIARIPAGLARHAHTATLLLDGRVLLAGGIGPKEMRLEHVELFDPATRTVTPAEPMRHARAHHAATLLPDGRVLVSGGESYSPVPQCEVWDPASGAWTESGEVAFARHSHTATLLPDGRVLLAGGASRANRSAPESVLDAVEAWIDDGGAPRATVAPAAAGDLPPCVACGAALSATRVVRHRAHFSSRDAGTWEFLLSCGSCLSAVVLDFSLDGHPFPPRLEAAGAVFTRLRDILTQADAEGRLQHELLRQMGAPGKSWMIGVPEILAVAKRALPKQVRLASNARLTAPALGPGDLPAPFRNLPTLWSLDKVRAFVSRAEQAKAAVGVQEGGWILPDENGHTRFGGVLALSGTVLEVSGFREGAFLVALPEKVQQAIGGAAFVQVALGVARPITGEL